RAKPPPRRTPQADRLGAECDRLHQIAAAAEPAIDEDRDLAADGVDDLRQDLERRRLVVQAAAAVVGHDDPVDALLYADPGILSRHDALHEHLALHERPDLVEVLPRAP